MKPKMTVKVLRGLQSMAANVSAGTDEDMFGYSEPKKWADVQRACEWIRGMADHKSHSVKTRKA